MPNPVVCPSCGAWLSDFEAVAGVPCPECRATGVTPTAEVPARGRAKVVSMRPGARDDHEDRDEFDDRRRSRGESPRAGRRGLKLLLIAGGVCALMGLVAVCGGGAYFFGDAILHPAPSGWTTASDAEGRYRVFLPGKVTSHDQAQRNGQAPGQAYVPPLYRGHFASLLSGSLQVHIESRPVLAGATAPATPEDLFKLWGREMSPWDRRDTLVAVQLGGHPGAEVRTFHNDAWMDDRWRIPSIPDWLLPEEKRRREDQNREAEAEFAAGQAERDRKARAGRASGEHKVVYLVATSDRFYIISARTTGGYADEGVLAILRNSFVIR